MWLQSHIPLFFNFPTICGGFFFHIPASFRILMTSESLLLESLVELLKCVDLKMDHILHD